MKFSLDHIVPNPIQESFSSGSKIWNKAIEINAADTVHVMAPSGTGKTTLIHILYGLRTDFKGTYLVDGVVNGLTDWDVLRADKIAVVFQDLRLLDGESALNNILLKNQLHNYYSLKEINDLAEELGVLKLLDKEVKQLSRGEKQRIAILRALSMPFSMILLDEPFSHLDPANAKVAAGVIAREAQKRNAGILMANLLEDSHFTYGTNFRL